MAPTFANEIGGTIRITGGTVLTRHYDSGDTRKMQVIEDDGGDTILVSKNKNGTGPRQRVSRLELELPEDWTPPKRERKTKGTARKGAGTGKPKVELPEGYVTPTGLAKAINDSGLYVGKAEGGLSVQAMYSYIRNAPESHPFPEADGHGRWVCQLDEGLAWWKQKNERTAVRKAR